MPIHAKFSDAVKALAAHNADPAVIKDILDSEDGLSNFGIDTPKKAAHFLAQTSHESGGFKIAIENMNYSAKRLMEVFKSRFPTLEKAQQFAGNPQKIGNFVYASRMGNGPPASGDGFRFRGRGIIQMTGRDMYKKVGEIVGIDLEDNPGLRRTGRRCHRDRRGNLEDQEVRHLPGGRAGRQIHQGDQWRPDWPGRPAETLQQGRAGNGDLTNASFTSRKPERHDRTHRPESSTRHHRRESGGALAAMVRDAAFGELLTMRFGVHGHSFRTAIRQPRAAPQRLCPRMAQLPR